MNNSPLLTVSEVASRLQLAERTVLRMIHKGDIPCLRIASQWRFLPDQIDSWLQDRTTEAATVGTGLSSLLETDPDAVPVSRLTGEHLILTGLRPGSHAEVLSQLIQPLVDAGLVNDHASYLDKLLARERMMPTAIGSGVAIPHIRNPRENSTRAPIMVIGVCPDGTDFAAPDGELTKLFFLVAADSDVTHLRLIARLNKSLLRPGIIGELCDSETPANVMAILVREDAIYTHLGKEDSAR
jgi:nitrogen PTS system EIIA component